MPIVFALHLPAAAANVPDTSSTTCTELFERRGIHPAELPSPWFVDPEDEAAILRFVDAVTPFPLGEQPDALERTLLKFWSLYRPDLSSAEISARLHPYRPTRFALSALRSDRPAKRVDVGRLRLWWMAFVRDVYPNAPRFSEAARHRAEILTIRQEPGTIVRFLREVADITTTLDVDAVTRATRILYRLYAPHRIPPGDPPPSASPGARNAEIVRIWSAYVAAVTIFRPPPSLPGPKYPIVLRHDLSAATDPLDVPLDPRAMIEYLVQRFPDVDAKSPLALTTYVNRLRAEYGLGPSREVFGRDAFRGVLHGRNKPAIRAMFHLWDELFITRSETSNP